MKRVFIYGLGLIGSSLAQALKLGITPVKITACDCNNDSLTFALKQGWIDEIAMNLEDATEADVIVLATPVERIITAIDQLAQMNLKKDVVVTDVGSTKVTVMKAAKKLTNRNVKFIGGHPMAGSHKSGAIAGRPDLFEGAYFIQIPAQETEQIKKAIQDLRQLFRPTRAKWVELNAGQHDKIVAQISHVPHVLAMVLVNQTKKNFAADPNALRLAAGGFKSVTRIAAADPKMWQSIMENNSGPITQQLTEYIEQLKVVRDLVTRHASTELLHEFSQAQQIRNSMKNTNNAPYYDLFVNIADRPGTLAAVLNELAAVKISVVNVEILEVRETIDGVLHITLRSLKDFHAARNVLQQKFDLVSKEG